MVGAGLENSELTLAGAQELSVELRTAVAVGAQALPSTKTPAVGAQALLSTEAMAAGAQVFLSTTAAVAGEHQLSTPTTAVAGEQGAPATAGCKRSRTTTRICCQNVMILKRGTGKSTVMSQAH